MSSFLQLVGLQFSGIKKASHVLSITFCVLMVALGLATVSSLIQNYCAVRVIESHLRQQLYFHSRHTCIRRVGVRLLTLCKRFAFKRAANEYFKREVLYCIDVVFFGVNQSMSGNRIKL